MDTEIQKKKTLLIVEDDQSIIKILADKFRDAGLEVVEANDGEEGLKAAFLHHPDIIIADILMPHITGTAMLKELRQDDWGKNVPVVVLTNLSDMQTIGTTLKAKACDYLIKAEWDLDKIVEHVKGRLGM